MQEDGTWSWFTRKVTGMWRQPVAGDFAVIAAASLRQEREALTAPRQQQPEIAAWEGEGGSTAPRVPSPRRGWLKRRRASYNSESDNSSSTLSE